MQPKEIYASLPEALRLLVDEIEAELPFEIQVMREADADRGQYIAMDPTDKAVGAEINIDQAIIVSPGSVEDITLSDYAHELLHLHRTFVQRVPHLWPKDRQANGSAASNLDNWLEHVVIYERQMTFVPYLKDELSRNMVEIWTKAPWDEADPLSQRFTLLTRLMVTRRYGNAEAKAAARSAMDRLGYVGASRAARECLAALGDKRALVLRAFRFLEINPSLFFLRTLDAKTGKILLDELA